MYQFIHTLALDDDRPVDDRQSANMGHSPWLETQRLGDERRLNIILRQPVYHRLVIPEWLHTARLGSAPSLRWAVLSFMLGWGCPVLWEP